MSPVRTHRGTLLLLVLMLASLVLLAVLTSQALRTASLQLSTAEQVLRDYAALAAAEYAREVQTGIGFVLLHRLGQRLAAEADPGDALERLSGEPERGLDAGAAIAGLWAWDGSGAAPRRLRGEGDDPALAAALAEAPFERVGRELPFAVVHLDEDPGPASYVLYPRPGSGHLVALLDESALAPAYAWAWSNEPLLPAVLAKRIDGNRGIHLEFRDRRGRLLYRTPGDHDPYLRHRHVIGEDYGGLYRGFTVDASIDPAFADELLIGGLPRSRLPLLLGLIAVTVAVVGATFYLLFKERALARLRSEFVARVSHELRTPLTQIRMFAETLALGRVAEPERAREYLGVINREAQRLSHLVDNVLAFSRREKTHHALRLGVVDLSDCVNEVARNFAPLAAARGDRIETRVDGALRALADREALNQILLNLLDNACKYGPEGQTVALRGWAETDRVCVSVEDAGPGIPDRVKRAIWEPYRRLKREETRALSGTGIGLSVARELIEAMAGSYQVQDVPGGGARFVVRLPAADSTVP